MVESKTIGELAHRLITHADYNDLLGTTQEGNDMRVAAALLIELESMLTWEFKRLTAKLQEFARGV